MTKQHPQPAFDFLCSLPVPPEVSFLMDWHVLSEIDAERGDPIRENPELWEYHELPDCLNELTTEDYVSILATPDIWEEFNLNAIAIGLGLENIEYEPEQFAGLVYNPSGIEATALLSPTILNNPSESNLVISISDNPEPTKKAIISTVDRIDEIDLLDAGDVWKDEIETKQVAELISSET